MVIIELTEEEKLIARTEADRRQGFNAYNGIKGRNGAPATGNEAHTLHLYGTAGEMAVGKYLNLKEQLYQDYVPSKGSYDLPYNIDVKTAMRHSDSLIVQLDDIGEKNYWLVTIQRREIRIHGWLDYSSCMQDKYIRDPLGNRPAYFVPQSALNPPETFYSKINVLA